MMNSDFSASRLPSAVKRDAAAAPKPTWFEYGFGFATTILYQGAFFPLVNGATTEAELQALDTNGDPVARTVRAVLLVLLVVLVVLRWRTMSKVLKLFTPYAVIVGICLLSTLWSGFPFLTIRRSVSLFACFLFAYYAFAVYGARNFLRLLAASTLLGSFASILLYIVAPSIALTLTTGHEDAASGNFAIRGVYAQKNELSVYNLLGICNCIYLGFLAKSQSKLDRRFLYTLPIFLTSMFLSRGMTSIMATAAVFGVTVLIYSGRSPKLSVLVNFATAAFVLIVVAILVIDPEIPFKLIGKDATLTGRLPIWIESMKAIAARPFFGYGYSASWNPDDRLTQYIWSRVGWTNRNAHNGFIQIALDIGFVGMFIYLYAIVRLVNLTRRGLRPGGLDESKWLVLFLIAMLIENLDEGTLAWPDLLAVEVAFGTAMMETWWRDNRPAIREVVRLITPRGRGNGGVLNLKTLPVRAIRAQT